MENKTMQFNKTRIEIGDFHINIDNFLQEPYIIPPLNVFTPDSYSTFCESLMEAGTTGLDYQKVSNGRQGKIVKKFYMYYKSDSFWRKCAPGFSNNNYAWKAWSSFIPVKTTISTRIVYAPENREQYKVSVAPKVFLFPFGWSTWLSFFVAGPHDLQDLSVLVKSIFNDPVFIASHSQTPLGLNSIWTDIASKIHDDIFGGEERYIRNPDETFVITTVMGKGAGSLSCRALDPDTDQPALHGIIDPWSSAVSKISQENIYVRKNESVFDFLVRDKRGFFNWQYHLMDGQKINNNKLDCYHRNTFISLMLAKLQVELLKTKIENREKFIPEFDTILENALVTLKDKPYKNASLLFFLGTDDIKTLLEKASVLLYTKPNPGKP